MAIQFWHMQMFSWDNSQFADHIPSILEHQKFIGVGNREENTKYIEDFCHNANVNDVVALKQGGRLIALVQIIGGVYQVAESDDELGWLVFRRPIRVLDWEIDERSIPHCRGTFVKCASEDVETTKVIKEWYEKIKISFEQRNIPLTV